MRSEQDLDESGKVLEMIVQTSFTDVYGVKLCGFKSSLANY